MIEFDKGLFRGPRLTSYEELMSNGIKTVLDLQGTPDNAMTCHLLLSNYMPIELNLCPILPPSKENVKDALWILDQERFRPLYMHCRKGVDRTGYIVAKYRISRGWSRDRAYDEWVEMGRSPWLDWWGWGL